MRKNNHFNKKNKAIALMAALTVLCTVIFPACSKEEAPAPTTETMLPTIATEAAQTEPQMEEASVNLGYGIYVTDIGSYTGMYMEDGSDEILSGILMMVVKNDGAQDIQYAEITMDMGETQANFAITTLPVGESMVVLEKNRLAWDAETDYSAILPKIENIAYFQDPVSTMEDKFEITIVDGAINVKNISGVDIEGTVMVYYKNAAEDLLYGGITYRVTIEGGLKADEIRQVMTKHASDTGSRIMFVTITQQ